MDPKAIQELVELISRSQVKRLELERKDFKLKLVKEDAPGGAVVQVLPATAVPVATPEAASAAAGSAASAAAEASSEGLYELNAPLVGTFYSAPGPDAPAFVKPGDRVSKGQVLCIVEAMKVMNEIESEINAEVVEILVSNGQPVEYGEVMYRMRPL